MKILYCIASYSSKGGTEKVLSSKASFLAENGHDVTILISDQHNRPMAYPLSRNVKIKDLKITSVLKGRIKFIGFIQNVLELRKMYKREIELINPDVIIVLERGYEDFVIPYVLKDIPKIREYHTSRKAFNLLDRQLPFFARLRKKLLRIVYENQYKKYDKLVLLTQKDLKSWRDYTNVTVIPNVIEYAQDKTDENILTRRKRIIAVGSMMNDQKGFSNLIAIWSKIEKDFPEWSLNIYGDGALRSYYQKLIDRLELKKIFLKGISDQIIEKYNESQIFVMTSNGEGFGLVIVEALSQKVPVIAYDCYCGPSDILVNDKGGFLIDFGDEEQFVTQLKTLMSDDALRQSKSLEASEVAKNFTTEMIMPKWINLFNELKR